jgi:hypothetical protein
VSTQRSKHPSSYRLSPRTKGQLEGLARRWGMNQSEVLALLIDRAHREEAVNETPSREQLAAIVAEAVSELPDAPVDIRYDLASESFTYAAPYDPPSGVWVWTIEPGTFKSAAEARRAVLAGDEGWRDVLAIIDQAVADDDSATVEAEFDRYNSREMTARDIATVEYYDQLPAAARQEYREIGSWADFADDPEAVEAEMDRIDDGRRARCLS